MSIYIKNVRSVLKHLIETCRDSQQGFLDAAQHVRNIHLKRRFQELALQRSLFAGSLQEEFTELGGEPERSGKKGSSLHRLDFKTRIAGKDDAAAIEEAERGEDAALREYVIAQELALPGNIREVVEAQYRSILDAYEEIRSLVVPTSVYAA